MYKVLKPLQGYGYLVGDLTDQIKPEDAEKFLAHKHIEIIEAPAKVEAPPVKNKSGKK